MSNLIEGELTHSIVGSFFTVYNYFGFGLIEAAYCGALELELKDRGHDVAREVTIPIAYHGRSVAWQRLDLVVDNKIIVEAKAGEILPRFATRQLVSYLHATPFQVGLLLHFGPEAKFERFIQTGPRRNVTVVPEVATAITASQPTETSPCGHHVAVDAAPPPTPMR